MQFSARRVLGASLMSLACHAAGAEGLRAPEWVWPAWQARLNVTLNEPSPAGGARTLRHAALLGDWYLQRHGEAPSARWRGGFRATSGLLLGPSVAAALPGASAISLLTAARDDAPGSETDLRAYLGVGYSGLAASGGWGFTADLGLSMRQPGAVPELGRALLGLRGWENTVRRFDLVPMLQLGVRYTF